MNGHQDNLPAELRAALMQCLQERNGKFEVVNMRGLLNLIKEHGEKYPVLLDLVKVNEQALVEHYNKTGEVPPGVRLIKTTTHEGDNITKLEIVQGPATPKS